VPSGYLRTADGTDFGPSLAAVHGWIVATIDAHAGGELARSG
jgi:hypothetical protein